MVVASGQGVWVQDRAPRYLELHFLSVSNFAGSAVWSNQKEFYTHPL